MIRSIEIGKNLTCIFCHNEFILEKVEFDTQAEYITCPHCKKKADIQEYHFSGNSLYEVLSSSFEEHINTLKIENENCRKCLWYEFENGKRGAFCTLNGEIDSGAEILASVRGNIHLEVKCGNKYYESCDNFLDRKQCLMKLRNDKRLK